MRRVKKELSLVDSYRFNKCCYKDVEARINEWMKDYIVANPYSSSCDPVKKRQQWQLTLENKKRNKVPRDVVRAIERVLGNPIYELFGATKEECAEVGILEDHNETPLATLTEEKLKALIAKRQASDNKLNNNKEKEEAPEHKMTECVSEGITNTDASNQSDRMPDAQEQTDTDSITNTNTIPAANTHTARVFRIGTLTEELLLSCASKRWKGARWKEALQKYVEEAVDLKCSDTIIKEAAKITYQLLDDTTLSCLQTSEGKCKAFYMFAKNFAISLDDVYGKGLETDEAVDFVTSLATTARRAVVQKSSDASAKRKFLIEEYLKAYLNEYPRRKKNRFHEIDEDLEHAAEDEDAYVDDGRPTLEQYLLHTALTGEQTGVTFSQMPTGEAKSYTIEEIICKAIKGVERYAELFDKYKRIIVTTIQNKLITPESLSEKHGEYQLSDEEYNQNVVVVRGLLENLKHNFARATELMPVDVLSSHQYKELENAYQNATTDSAVRFSGFNDADTVADAKIQLRVSDANRALFRYAIGNKELMDAAESRAMAKYERENSEKPEKERISWEHLPKKERVKRRRSEEATIICTEKEYEWMTILWPSLLVFRRKVIFTTVSKMQFQYLDIENGVSLPYDTWTEDALVFADEGDASKGYQTMQYVKNQYNEIYDLKLLLTCLHDQLNEALERTDIRNMKGNWSKWKHHYDLHYDDNNKKKRITDLGDGLGTMRSSYRYLKKIMEKYHLKSCFKLKQADTVSNKEMIWYVYAGGLYFIADASGKRGELAAFYNKTTGQVDVYKLIYGKDTSISDEKDKLRMQYGEENEINLVHMTSAMRGFIINFAQVMRELAWAYQDIDYQYKLENNKKGILVQSKMTERSAWHNVLIAFGMDDEHNTRSEYLMNQIPPSKLKRKKGIMSPFYAFGWSATIVIATEDNREDIRFSGFNVPTTPEMILGIEASNGRVFCLSGTMDIDSSIANYNRNELIGMLGEEHVSSLSEDPIWMSHVVDELEAKWLPYRDGRIKTNADYGNWPVVYHPDDTETDKDIATMHMLQAYLVNYPECAHEIGEIINTATSACEQSECDFARGRLITFARHVDRFVKESIPAFLHFEKRLPVDDTKRRGNEWSERTLTNIFNILVEAHKKATGNDTSVALVVLRAATFNDEKTWQDIKDRREQGERQYLITAYNTAGVGVNVESKKPVTVSDDQIVLLPLQNKEDARLQKMDVSSVYLGPITNNLVPVVTNVNNMNDVVARIDETLHLVNGGDIIASEGRRSMITIMDLLQGVSGSRDDYRKDGYLKMAGYRKIAERDVLQAIGRISRGGCKLKNIDIYISTDIGTVLSRNLLDDDESAGGSCSETPKKRHPKILLTPEAEAVYRALQKAQAGVLEDDRKYRILRQNMTHGIEFHSHVQSLIHREYGVASMNPDQMDAYRGLRKEVVKTYSSNDKRCFSNIMFSYFEEPVNSYYYSKKNDYECCIIDAEKITVDAYKNSDVVLEKDYDGTAEISERIFRFDILFAYPGMREHFMENNMFTTCEKGQFVLCPEAANLARGEQGEMAGKFILRKELGMICNDITDGVRYERFDVELNSDVYIDFKNYADGEISTSRLNDLITYTQKKAIKVGAKKAYIVNLIQAEDVTSKTYDADIESFVPIVYINGLLDKEGSVIPSHLSQFLEGDYGQSND